MAFVSLSSRFTPSRFAIGLTAGALACWSLSACGGGDSRAPEGHAAPAAHSVIVPNVQVKAGTLLTQKKGDTEATLSIEPAKLVITQDKTERVEPSMAANLANKTNYAVTVTDDADFTPAKLQILVVLKNQGAVSLDYWNGAQVECQLNGKPTEINIDTEGVTKDNVPAKAALLYRISGPMVETLKVGDSIGLTMHKLVVAAGPNASIATPVKADFNWELTITADRTVELKTTTTSEWR